MYLTLSLWVRHWNFAKIFGAIKLGSLGYLRHCLHDHIFRYNAGLCQTDGQTHGRGIHRASVAPRGKSYGQKI